MGFFRSCAGSLSIGVLVASAAVLALDAAAVGPPTMLDPAWQVKTRAMFRRTIEIPSVVNRGLVPRVAELVVSELEAAGFAADSIRVLPYEGMPGDETAALIFRWRARRPAREPMLILAHMDVVEAKRDDWRQDPFAFIEKDGYFYGRGTRDIKSGVVATVMALAKLKAESFEPTRDIVLFFTGDEETTMHGALRGSTEWRNLLDAEFALNADGGGGAYDRSGRPLYFGFESAEKTYQTYFFTVRNRGGHSSRPRPDNAIYELADALKNLQAHRFAPTLNDTTRAYFEERQKDEPGSLGDAMRRWLANPNDGGAADEIEASELETGQTRTRCVATMLSGGHADNALPQMARAAVNCRIMPGVEPRTIQAELQQFVGAGVEVTPDQSFIGKPSPVLPIRPEVMAAYAKAVHQVHGAGVHVLPQMTTGTSDASFFRAVGIPVYGADGSWGIVPDDERAHGLDERIPVPAMYDDVLHWETMVRELAGR